jgi:hypothetical protein
MQIVKSPFDTIFSLRSKITSADAKAMAGQAGRAGLAHGAARGDPSRRIASQCTPAYALRSFGEARRASGDIACPVVAQRAKTETMRHPYSYMYLCLFPRHPIFNHQHAIIQHSHKCRILA